MLKKRKKNSRHRGSHTHGTGFKKKGRGKGHHGGKGMAGSGKRADHKKSLILAKFGPGYYGRSKTLRKPIVKKLETISLYKLAENIQNLVIDGKATQSKEVYEVNLGKKKLLSSNIDLKLKLKITVLESSKAAAEKVKAAGGEVILSSSKK